MMTLKKKTLLDDVTKLATVPPMPVVFSTIPFCPPPPPPHAFVVLAERGSVVRNTKAAVGPGTVPYARVTDLLALWARLVLAGEGTDTHKWGKVCGIKSGARAEHVRAMPPVEAGHVSQQPPNHSESPLKRVRACEREGGGGERERERAVDSSDRKAALRSTETYGLLVTGKVRGRIPRRRKHHPPVHAWQFLSNLSQELWILKYHQPLTVT